MGRRITQAVIIMVPTAMHIIHDPTGATGTGHTDTGTTIEKSARDLQSIPVDCANDARTGRC
jgi:hypothetical protein